jgi:large subunit ribosomal protein L25
MEDLVIEVERRESTGKGVNRKLRRSGIIPAVVYGGGREPVPVTVDRQAVTELFRQEKGRNTVFLLKMKGTKQERHALLVDAQTDPLTGQYVHLDFIRVVKGQLVKVEVPIVLEGEAEGVKVGGFLDWVRRNLHVECDAQEIPEALHVDVSEVGLGEHLTAGDVPLPAGVTLRDEPHTVVVTIEKHGIKLTETEGGEEAAAEAAESGEEPAEPEVIRRGRAAEQTEEGE